MKKWISIALSFLVGLSAIFLPEEQAIASSDQVYKINYTRTSGGTWTWQGAPSPNIVKKIELSFTKGQLSNDTAYLHYQTTDGEWITYGQIPSGFDGTIDLKDLNAVNVMVSVNRGTHPLEIKSNFGNNKVSAESGYVTTNKPIKDIVGSYGASGGGGPFDDFNAYVILVTSSGTQYTYQFGDTFDASKNFTKLKIRCEATGVYVSCYAGVSSIGFVDGSRWYLYPRLTIKTITVGPPVEKPDQPVLVPSILTLTNRSATRQNMSTTELNVGRKIEQVAIQLSSFYGTYDLQGWDAALNAWITLDPSGLTTYNSPQPESVHTGLKWLDLRTWNITKLRLTADHASYYGTPSQVSVPIVRTQYNGPNVDLPPASPYNVTLEWSDGGNKPDVVYDIIRQVLHPDGTVALEERIGTTSDLTFTTTDQVPGKWYRYYIRASIPPWTNDSDPVDYYTPPVVSVTPGEQSLNLSWTPVAHDDPYSVYIEEDGAWRKVLDVDGRTGQATITNLSPSKRYRVRLEQESPSFQGPRWSMMAANGAAVAPLWNAPGTPTFSNLTSNSVTISWDPKDIPPGTTFRLYRDGTKIYEGTQPSFTDITLSPGTEYRYKVTALNPDGIEGTFSPEASIQTPTLVAPVLSLSSTQASNPWNVILTWEASGNSPTTTYEVWRQTLDPSGNVILDQKIGTTSATSFETSDQTNGKFYRYRVRAVQGTDYLESNTVSYWTAPAFTVTAAEGALQLSWTSPAQGASFNVYVHSGTDWQLVRTTSDTSVIIDFLSPTRKHQVALEPANLPNGGFPWRSTAEGTPLWHAPGEPIFTSVQSNSVTITWNPNGIPAGQVYQLFRNGMLIWQGVATSFTDTNLTPGMTYTYKVAALNAQGIPGTFSPEAAVTTIPASDPPEPPPAADPIPAPAGILQVEGARLASFSDGDKTYSQIPHVRSRLVTLRWNLVSEPEWIRYGTSSDSLGEKRAFNATHLYTLTEPWEGLHTIFAQLSTGELYYVTVVLDTEAPSVSASWSGGSTVTRQGGRTTLILDAQDNLADEADLEVSIDSGPWQRYTSPMDVQLSGSGLRDVVIRVRDPAGNISRKTLSIFVLP